MLTTRTIQTLGWQTAVSDTVFGLSPSVVAQGLNLLSQANAAFAPEPTAAWELTGGEAPTIICRLDFTIVGENGAQLTLPSSHNGHFPVLDGEVGLFEFEERPAGLGLTAQFNPKFAAAFGHLRSAWPDMRVVVAPDRRGYDDQLWVGTDRLTVGTGVPNDGSYLIVRAEPEQSEYHPLASRSVSSLTTKGNKSYGEKLGWWTQVSSLDELPVPGRGGEIVVLKPLQGSKARGILIAPPRNADSQPGMVTRSRLEREFAKQVRLSGGMFLQPWWPPIRVHDANLTIRAFFGRGVHRHTGWHCLGGVWNLRRNALVHGAQDTVFGPAIPV